jgi:hypothetical protein
MSVGLVNTGLQFPDGTIQTTAISNTAITNTALTFTATQTFNGSSSTEAINLLNAAESANVIALTPDSTQTLYVAKGAVVYFTTNATNNWVTNLSFSSDTSINTAMSINNTLTVVMLTTQGSTAYYNTGVQVDGTTSGVTTCWQGGYAPTQGNASGIDVYTYTIIKTASATYTVLASQTQF